jgi:hypothetical protein
MVNSFRSLDLPGLSWRTDREGVPWACGPPMVMKIVGGGSSISDAGNGTGCHRSGYVEAARESDRERVFLNQSL